MRREKFASAGTIGRPPGDLEQVPPFTTFLQGTAYRVVLGVCSASKAPAYQHWKELGLHLADAASESRDTVKYLTTLEGSLECLYTSELHRHAFLVSDLPQLAASLIGKVHAPGAADLRAAKRRLQHLQSCDLQGHRRP